MRDTASSHQRAFLIETMGRQCGYLALASDVITGSEMVLIPEHETTLEDIAIYVNDAYTRGKAHCIIVAAEGAKLKVSEVAKFLSEHEIGFETRVTILGHVPRGGSPSAFDRMLATRMGVTAARNLLQGSTDEMVGLAGRELVSVPLADVGVKSRQPNLEFLEMVKILAQ